MSDVYHAVRALWRRPGFTLTAALTLALGIGLSTAMFCFADAVLLKPFHGIAEGEPLVLVGSATTRSLATARTFNPSTSAPAYLEWRARNRVFSRIGAVGVYPTEVTIAGRERAELLRGRAASSGFFETLGIQPMFGRSFRAEEDLAGGERAVLLPHRVWMTRWAGDPAIVGQTITLNREPHRVVGVLPANPFLDRQPTDLWLALAMPPDEIAPDNNFLSVHARLKPGVTPAQAEADVQAIQRGLEGERRDTDAVVRVRPFRDRVVGRDVRHQLWLLAAAVAFILLITCTNVAHLLAARYAHMTRDIALRLALGAHRARVVRQLMAESLVLALAGGAGGLLLAHWLVRAFMTLMPAATLPPEAEVVVDARVIAFTIGLCTIVGIVFGALPAWSSTRTDLVAAGLNARGGSAGTSRRARQLLLVTEVALTFVLVSGSALLLRSLVRLSAVDPGFETSRVVALRVKLDPQRYAELPRILEYQRAMLERIGAVPGTASAAVANVLPLTGLNSSTGISRLGVPTSRTGTGQRIVSPAYFATMGIGLVSGRGVSEVDRADGPRAVVINQTLARSFWPDQNPLGAQLVVHGRPATVVGVAQDVKHQRLSGPTQNEIYIPFTQAPESETFGQLSFIVRTAQEPAVLLRTLAGVAAAVDRDVAVVGLRTMDEYLADSLAQPRFTTSLFGLFAMLALVLAAVGIYGVFSYLVNERTREFGIRLALGAQRRDLFRLVLTQGLAVILVGTTIGLIGALVLARALSTVLFGITTTDPATYAATLLVLVAVALLGCWQPARRATSADPLVVLRRDG